MIETIEAYLDELLPNPRCELNFNKDYELLIAVVLSAQTTDKRVNTVTEILFTKYPSLKELKNAPLGELEKILMPIGTFKKKAVFVKEIAKLLDEKYDSQVPNDRVILESMPGVGRKTTNVVLSVLFEVPAIAVDTHVQRVSKRLNLAKEHDDVIAIEKKLMKLFKKEVWSRRHHQLVLFGRYYCKASAPQCENCKLIKQCKYAKKSHIVK